MEKKPAEKKPFEEAESASEVILDDLQVLYGPPEFLFLSDNENEDLYGPPSAFDPSDNNLALLYGPPEFFAASGNENEDLYGPPPSSLGDPEENAVGES